MSTHVRLAPCALAGVLVFAASPAASSTLEVCPTAYPTIQSGVDAAADGDVIAVCAGTYAEHVVIEDKILEIRPAFGLVTIESLEWVYDAGHSDVSGSIQGITFTGDVTIDTPDIEVELTRCTLQGATTLHTYGLGSDFGGLWLTDDHFAGAIQASCEGNNVALVFEVCTFEGGLSASGEGGPGPEVTGCTFLSCDVDLWGEHVSLEDCIIVDGGASVYADPIGSGWAEGNVISGAAIGLVVWGEMVAADNEIRGCDVGIQLGDGEWSVPNFAAAVDNRVFDCGTGIFANACDEVYVDHNVVARCDVGVHLYTHPGEHMTAALVDYNTIDGSRLEGLRVDIRPEDLERLEGNIVTNGSSGVTFLRAGDLYAPPACNDVWGNTVDWLGTPDPTGTGGNISEDPLFCLATPDDRRIDPGSPCAEGNPGGEGCGCIGALGICTVLATPATTSVAVIPPLRVLGTPGDAPVYFALERPFPAGTRIEIFNAAGARVAAVPVEPGVARASWDGRTDRSGRVGPGVYWACIGRGAEAITHSFVIVR